MNSSSLPTSKPAFSALPAALGFAAALCITLTAVPAAWAQGRSTVRPADHIAAVVNQELVTAGEVLQRIARVREEAQRAGQRLPPDAEMRQRALEALIEERVVLSHARDSGVKVDEPDVDRALAGVAAQNQLSLVQLRERLRTDGVDFARFRADLRDRLLIERIREREVPPRIRVSDLDIDNFIVKQRGAAVGGAELNIAQILVTVPESAAAPVQAERRAKAEAALARVRGGADFAAVARELSEDPNRERGGEIGLRPEARLPDLFVEAVSKLKAGEVAPALVKSGAGFHVLKLMARSEGAAFKVTQTRARHILLRPSAQLNAQAATRRLADYKRQIESGAERFEDLARKHSQDGTAEQGGDLGWTAPGNFVPEFEEAMNALALGGISAPLQSRFGIHLIQVVERREVALDERQQREQARNVLREQKFDEAYAEWVKELRARAYVELREAPL